MTAIDQLKFSVQLERQIGNYRTENGTITIDKLSKGQYYCIELEAPRGYLVNKEAKHAFEISGNTSKTIILEVEIDPQSIEEPILPTSSTIEDLSTTNPHTEITSSTTIVGSKPVPSQPNRPGSLVKKEDSGSELPRTGESVKKVIWISLNHLIISSGLIILPKMKE